MKLFNHLLVVFGGILIFASAQLVIDENTPKRLFDEELYRNVIDNEECQRQVRYMMDAEDKTLLGRFLDAGVKFPRGVFMLSLGDLGNYDQCLAINEEIEDMKIEGKYYFLSIPFNQTFRLPFDESIFVNFTNNGNGVRFNRMINEDQQFVARVETDTLNPENPLVISAIEVAVCVPKPCTSYEWTSNVLFNVTAFGFQYDEVYCRLPNDKPWVAADYVAIVLFSLLGFITLLSTLYDMNHILIQKRDPKKANIYFRSFSVYTNTQRLLTFVPNSNAIECLDGIRSISMMWVIVGHTFSMYNFNANLTEYVMWITSGDAIWITTGVFSVDSFFLMAGLLLTYTTVGKMSGVQLVKRLHLFYLNRLLRMFPLLAALVLLEASVFHRVADGPNWRYVGDNVQNCRTFWWTTLLYVQNYVNPDHICIPHSWYVAIDIQLYLVSPIVLFWVLGKNRKVAWTALISSLLAILVAATVWNFIYELPSSSASIIRLEEQGTYLNNYYVLAWTRGSPFFLGMIVGYILNIYKGKEMNLNMGFVLISWIISLGMIALTFYTSYMVMQLDWDNQVGDSLVNSFSRLIWSIGLSWIIFACVKGYGGPINWLLTLSLWKLPARISYAMYLYHYSITFIIAGMQITTIHFSMGARIFDFLAVFVLSFVLAFFVTVVIDAPFSVLIKILMEGGQRRRRPPAENGTNSLKPGPIPEKNIADLEKTMITDLEKNGSNMEKNVLHLEKNGSSHDKNGITDRMEVIAETLPSKENS